MTRWSMLLGAMMLVGGCSQEQTASAPSQDKSAVPAAKTDKAASKLYFETKKDGKTYVLGNVASLQTVARGEQLANAVVKENFGPAGETVVFESDGAGMDARLIEDYGKQHPKK